MLAVSRERAQVLKQQWGVKEVSPERTKVWIEPKMRRRVAVVYYLSRNGRLEQPHFMEVSLSSNDGLYLKDVINRLNAFRGRGVAKMYSWSSKRSYKNGFVWHDLCEDDFIFPVRGNEYVLKGTEILQFSSSSTSLHSSTSSTSTTSSGNKPHIIQKSVRDDITIDLVKRKNTSRKSTSFDKNEYKAYKSNSSEFTFNSTDASTQTDKKAHRRQSVRQQKARKEFRNDFDASSSLKSLKTVSVKRGDIEEQTLGNCSSARMRASALLMHLLSCASVCETKEQRLSSVSSYYNNKQRVPRTTINEEIFDEVSSFHGSRLDDREYYSGNLVEKRKIHRGVIEEDLQSLQRSSSFNACRNSRLDVAKEIGVQSKCMPKKSNTINDENHFVSLSCIKHGINMISSEEPSN